MDMDGDVVQCIGSLTLTLLGISAMHLILLPMERSVFSIMTPLTNYSIPCLSCPLFVFEKGITISVCVQIC